MSTVALATVLQLNSVGNGTSIDVLLISLKVTGLQPRPPVKAL